MDENVAVERLLQQVKEYANGGASDVARGAETPRLAALLVQKYGRGVVDALAVILTVREPLAQSLGWWTTKRPRLILSGVSMIESVGPGVLPMW